MLDAGFCVKIICTFYSEKDRKQGGKNIRENFSDNMVSKGNGIESVAMQLGTCEFTLTAHIAVSHKPLCAADKLKHSGDRVLRAVRPYTL